ncbi:PH domain-containing protein [Cellulomonas dongxiuzhuiae]|uniref:PH domain-containing protein n=1 Tax=Cellulomonas dongxiuzhuiae TaxID=2819979 RepID=A0ABX8GLV8_9CELL|nr:PH domain-containing protein [Cellulomonas dongxiuzhuiae]MBO3089950.1 PH domain-containing protein [Cellulomonas dongxiuzhuiae]MBO3095719.1 PH domain-containing protein [Cellulomonas dongxiuzhuiae]QWC16666.1 PH domain-containing protein [Cellulomonas dongxiuzhuiae]
MTTTPGTQGVASGADPFDLHDVAWTAVSPRLATARLVVLGVWAVVLLAPTVALAAALDVAWLWAVPAVLAAALLWGALLVHRQVRTLRYAERADDLLIRKGIMFRSLVVVPYGRMQFVDVSSGPLARRLGIATVQLHTAAPGTDATIPGLPPAEAARLRDRLASRGEARLAGL